MTTILNDDPTLTMDDEATLERLEELHESDDERRERAARQAMTPRCPRCGHEMIARPRGRVVGYVCGCASR